MSISLDKISGAQSCAARRGHRTANYRAQGGGRNGRARWHKAKCIGVASGQTDVVTENPPVTELELDVGACHATIPTAALGEVEYFGIAIGADCKFT